MISLRGKVAIVTGGATGIGRATALLLGELGASVVVVARSSIDQANQVVDAIRKMGARAIAVRADVSSPRDCELAVQACLSEFGAIDLLINNAGTTRDRLLVRMSDDDWDQVYQTNLRGTFLLTRAVLPSMITAASGKIISVTSVIGLIGNPGQANYASSKAAITGMTHSLAKEVACHNIQVNCVAPGYIETKLTEGLSERHQADLLSTIPLGRLGRPEDISGVIAFLCSSSADYITGQTIVVDGGMLA